MSSKIPSYVWGGKKRWTNQKSSSSINGTRLSRAIQGICKENWCRKFSSYPTYSWAKKTNEIVREIDESIRMDQEEYGQNFIQKSVFIDFIHGNDERNSDFIKVQNAERDVTCFASFLLGCQMTKKEIGMDWQNKLRKCILDKSIESLKKYVNFQDGEMIKKEAFMHFNADDSLVKMIVDLVSSSNDFCIVFGTTKYGFDCFLHSKTRKTSLRLDLDFLQMQHVSSCFPISGRNLSAWNIKSLLLVPNQKKKKDSGRKSERKKRRRNCSLKQGLYKTARNCPAHLAEKLTDESVLKVDEHFNQFAPKQNWTCQKEKFLF